MWIEGLSDGLACMVDGFGCELVSLCNSICIEFIKILIIGAARSWGTVYQWCLVSQKGSMLIVGGRVMLLCISM